LPVDDDGQHVATGASAGDRAQGHETPAGGICMTPSAVAELVASTPLPSGYELRVRQQRKFALRSLWSVQVWRDGEKAVGRAWYNPAAGVLWAQATAWAMSREAA
jgi:hypothetical protein